MKQAIEQQNAQSSQNRCFICSRTGNFRRWQLCQNNHFEYVCDSCLLDKPTSNCLVKDCNASCSLKIVTDLVTSRKCWIKSYDLSKSVIGKYTRAKEELGNFSASTRQIFTHAVQRVLRTASQGVKPRFFSDYIQKLASYILNCKLAVCREQATKALEMDDKINSETWEFMKKFEQISSLVSAATQNQKTKTGTKKQKLQKFTINCLICFNNSNVLYNWRYCENQHVHNYICKGCLFKLKECPVCRGKLRILTIKGCEESMAEWEALYNKYISISEMANLMNSQTLSSKTKESIYMTIRDSELDLRTKLQSNGADKFKKLIEHLALEWCYEQDKEKTNRLMSMVENYEDQHQLVMNLKTFLKKRILQLKNDVVVKAQCKMESDSSEESEDSSVSSGLLRLRGDRFRRRRNRSPSRSVSQVSSRSRSRSRSRNRSRSGSRNRRQVRIIPRPAPPNLPPMVRADRQQQLPLNMWFSRPPFGNGSGTLPIMPRQPQGPQWH